jgi:hypothetical protein
MFRPLREDMQASLTAWPVAAFGGIRYRRTPKTSVTQS